METKVTTPAIKGTLLALVLIVIGLAIYFTGQSQNKSLGYVSMGLYAGAIIFSCTYYAKQMGGIVTFGNVFAYGFKTAAAATAIFLVYTFIAFKFIMPEMVDLSLDAARKGMEEKKNLTSEQVEQSLEMVRKFFIPFAIGGALFMYLFIGVIAALIGAAVAKKTAAPSPFEQ